MRHTVLSTLLSLAAALLLLGAVPTAWGLGVHHQDTPTAPRRSGPIVKPLVKHDVSPPLHTLKGAPTTAGGHHVIPLYRTAPLPMGKANGLKAYTQPRVTPHMPTPSTTFDGVGNGFTGPQGTFSVNFVPPDTNGAVGPQDYVQIVNAAFAVFNKDPSRGTVGAVRFGPVANNILWSGFGGLCQTDNDGDPTVVYDSIANRWVISQFAVTNPNPNYYECVAVSTSSDPTGSYYRYAAAYSSFPDYPKMAVWPDAYYETYNLYQSIANPTFLGAEACAFDRAAMLSGAAATQVCFQYSSSDASLLPSSLDGSRQPPSGSPNYLIELGTTTSLTLWKFHVDFAIPSNSTITGPFNISVASYTEACGGGTCIPQSGTAQQLDSLGDRLMYRLAYRNFGGYESLVVDHGVTAGSSAGMRWYEIRNPSGTPALYQEGTYAPDSSYRWMGSIAEDHVGDMAMGFSQSSSTLFPGISYTGRLANDPLGTMAQGETSLIVGTGSQMGSQYSNRWGDYTSIAVDPIDDCTFWYTNEYIPTNGTFNWKTRIGSFTYPSCLGTQLIQNGGFESGTANWTEYSADGQQTIYASTQAHSGTQAFFPCGYAACDDRIWQTVTVPATVNSATLAYWLRSFSPLGAIAPSAPCLDHFYATLASPDGTVLSGGQVYVACETVATSGYTRESFDITSLLQGHAGQQLVIMFRGTTANEVGSPGTFTHWGVDDISLLVS